MARWVAAWGGTFLPDKTSNSHHSAPDHKTTSRNSSKDDSEITHVLATPAQFRDGKNGRVARARKGRPGTGPHIVTADWLEDSIAAKRRLPEKRFSLRERQRLENARRRRAERAEKGVEKGKRLVNDCEWVFFFRRKGGGFGSSLSPLGMTSPSLHYVMTFGLCFHFVSFYFSSHFVFWRFGC